MARISPFPIGEHRVDDAGRTYDKELDLTEPGKSAGLLTPPPERSISPNPARRVSKRGLNVIGWCDSITGALHTIEMVVKSDTKSCKMIDNQFHKVKQESLFSEENPTGLRMLSPCYIGDDGYIYPSEWVLTSWRDPDAPIEGEPGWEDYIKYNWGRAYDWKPGTEPTGAVIAIPADEDNLRYGVANYTKSLYVDDKTNSVVEGNDYLTWHATLSKRTGEMTTRTQPWSSGFFPGNWRHVSDYRFAFSFIPFKFSNMGWFSWVCNYLASESTNNAILKYTPSNNIRYGAAYGGGSWPKESSTRSMPVRILDYSSGRALCDTRDITYSIESEVGIENRRRVADFVTLRTATAHGLVAGDYVLVSGVGGVGYNGRWYVASVPNTTHFNYLGERYHADEDVSDTGGTAQLYGSDLQFSGAIELWHIDGQQKLADIWKARASDMEYDPQGFGIDKTERVISGSISNDKVVLLTVQNFNVKIGDMLFVAPDGGWADTTDEGEAWAAGAVSYWEKYIAMIRSGTYIWIHQANAVFGGHGQWIYPAGPAGYVNLFCQSGPYAWEFDRRYRVYVYDIGSGSLAEVTLPDVNMQAHLKRNGGQINGTWMITGGPTWETSYRTWFDVVSPDLMSPDNADGLYFSGKSGSRIILHPLTNEVIGVQSPEHVCGIINAADGLVYVPLNYKAETAEVYGEDDPRAGEKIVDTNIRLYCYGLTPDSDGAMPALGYVTGPRGETDGICYFNYKSIWVETGA